MDNANRSRHLGLCRHLWPGVLEKGLLSSVDEQLRVFDGRMLQNTVAEVHDVSPAAKLGDQAECRFTNFFLGAKEHGRVQIPLECDIGPSHCAQFREGNAPVDAENVGSDFDDRGKKVVGRFAVINDGN